MAVSSGPCWTCPPVAIILIAPYGPPPRAVGAIHGASSSHSLGARLVIPAIGSADRLSRRAERTGNISNIILASPDVDRETFERDIVEEVLAPDRVALGRRG